MNREKIILFLIYSLFVTLISITRPIKVDFPLVEIILTASTFLFGIFVGFSLQDRVNRIDKIREQDSIERASLVELYHLSKNFGKNFTRRIQNIIDNYLMATLDYNIFDYDKTVTEFNEIVESTRSLTPKNKNQEISINRIFSLVSRIGEARKQTISIIADRFSFFEWLVFLGFSSVILVSLYVINSGTAIFILLTVLLSFSVGLLIFLLHSLDNLEWKQEVRIFEPYQKTFEEIGKLRYYPNVLIDKGRVKLHKGKPHRVAIYLSPYPNFKDKKIIIKKG